MQIQHIGKRYPGVVALDNVTLSLLAGEVHCLVGENGAGKSTLLKILSGAIVKDEGAIFMDGKKVLVDSPVAAHQLGIGVIHQELNLVPDLSVAENILLGNEPMRSRLPFLDKDALHTTAYAALHQLGEELDTAAAVGHLSIAQRQIVEIARALSRSVRILALDEPSASLTAHEIERLFRVIRRLKGEGVAILYISHRLEEVFELGDSVTVLRDGRVVHSSSLHGLDRGSLIKWMVGRELENEFPPVTLHKGSELLRVENVSSDRLHDINFTLRKGEVLGLAGLVGAGRTELARVLFGADKKVAGRVFLEGREINLHSPYDAVQSGIALLTEDRNRLGLVLDMNVKENISLASLNGLLFGPFIDRMREERVAQQHVDELHIRPADIERDVRELSGGNRQKVVLARWLDTMARVLIFDEPTAGIDVGARYEIYTIINKLAWRGVGIVVISSDLPELLGMCTRIVVMCEGRVTGEVDKDEATQELIMELATSRTYA